MIKMFQHIDKKHIFNKVSEWILRRDIDCVISITFCDNADGAMSSLIVYRGISYEEDVI